METSIGAPSVPSSTDTPTTTETPTTTTAPPTTIDPAEALAAEVEADFREAIRLGREASQDPFDLDVRRRPLIEGSELSRRASRAKLERYREENLAIRENPDVPASISVEVPARLIAPSEDVVEMQVCEVDSWIVVEVGAGPSGSDAIVNPDFVAYRAQIFMRNVDGIWRYEGGNDLESWENSQVCPA